MTLKTEWKKHINNYGSPTIFKHALLRPYFSKLRLKGAVLDVGCGTGYFSELLAANGMSVFGVDQNPVRLKQPLAKYFRGEASDLPFEDGYFNSILMINVLSVIEKPKERVKILMESKRVKKQGGTIFIINASEKLYDPEIRSEVFNYRPIAKNKVHSRFKKIDGEYIEFDDFIVTTKMMGEYSDQAGLKITSEKNFYYRPLGVEVYKLYKLK